MEMVFGLIAITALLVVLIALVLLWAVRSGQFEDLEGPAWRVVLDDDEPARPPRDAHACEPGQRRPPEPE